MMPFAMSASTHALFEGSKDQACAGANLNDTGCSANQGVTQVNSTISTVINLLSFLVGVISVIMIIIGGIRFVTSQGNAQNATSARNTILFAVIGLALAAFAQLIVKFVLGKATT
jgi:hypothetical protein